MIIADELQKLQQLHQCGAISDAEYTLAKARLLAQPQPAGAMDPVTQEQQARQWGFFLHLSMLAGFAVPFAGLVAPIVIWQLKKDELPGIDEHGKNAVNWIISSVIYAVVGVILIAVVIGIPWLLALALCAVIFPLVAAFKANNGEVWKYPLAITFLK